ncbi:hypothetical protein CYMTET_47538 [Cymbomonas tetramitiformis]|uniref:Uncharacterized protein n=1 Tax=Cymbomonas tetramitiformis TaxID=36881 RepID=A0AAE0BV43_9CHLO|nr:hypothetical protein CYMTET_47538 [Cymbomonas tetramitiformis]
MPMPTLGAVGLKSLRIGAPSTFKVESRVMHKATKKHTKTRPKKKTPADRQKGASVYETIAPEEVPPVFTVVKEP